jgi:hypothetical protein
MEYNYNKYALSYSLAFLRGHPKIKKKVIAYFFRRYFFRDDGTVLINGEYWVEASYKELFYLIKEFDKHRGKPVIRWKTTTTLKYVIDRLVRDGVLHRAYGIKNKKLLLKINIEVMYGVISFAKVSVLPEDIKKRIPEKIMYKDFLAKHYKHKRKKIHFKKMHHPLVIRKNKREVWQRRALIVTQARIAKLLNVNTKYISAVLTGRTQTTLKRWMSIQETIYFEWKLLRANEKNLYGKRSKAFR